MKNNKKVSIQIASFLLVIAGAFYFISSAWSVEACFLDKKEEKCIKSYRLEVADTQSKRSLGLMYRDKLEEDSGMIFIFPESREITMWMKDTRISLDMIFLDSNFRIQGIVESTKPFSTESLGIGKESKYVIELKAGEAKKHGLSSGQMVRAKNL